MSEGIFEDEFYDDEDDFEFGDTFLLDEENNINMVMIPEFKFNVYEFIENYLLELRKCKTNDEARNVLLEFYNQITLITLINNESAYLQERVQNLEELISALDYK